MNENASPARLVVPDIAKGIGIFGVVLTHLYLSPSTSSASVVSTGLSSVPMQLLYAILMMFFVVSGYFYRPRGFVVNVRKRILQLAVAFVACTSVLPLILYGYMCMLGFEMDFWNGYCGCLMKLIGNFDVFQEMGDPYLAFEPILFDTTIGYYFLNLMIFSFLLFYAIADRVLSDRRYTYASMAVLVAATAVICEVSPIHLPFQIELIPIAVAFMVFGAYLAQLKVIETIGADGVRSRRFWIMFVAFLAFSAVVACLFPLGKGFHIAYFGEYGGWSAFPYFLVGCSMTFVVFYIAELFSKIPYLSKFMAFIGSHTLAILLLHGFIGKVIGFAITHDVGNNYFPALNAPAAIFSVLATMVIASYIGKCASGILKHRKV